MGICWSHRNGGHDIGPAAVLVSGWQCQADGRVTTWMEHVSAPQYTAFQCWTEYYTASYTKKNYFPEIFILDIYK